VTVPVVPLTVTRWPVCSLSHIAAGPGIRIRRNGYGIRRCLPRACPERLTASGSRQFSRG
jgi:hypothetical protein